MTKRILTFVLNYFPGYLSGGVARTILNTTAWLGDDFKFLIVTRDRDLGSDAPYTDVALDAWNPMGPADVRYLAPSELSMGRLARFINATDHDLIHFNSFLDPVFTIRVMLLMKLGRIRRVPVLMSPRGEFGAGSLALKYPKKKAYIEAVRLLRFYDGVTWHASSPYEAEEMAAVMKLPLDAIKVALDLPVRHAAGANGVAPGAAGPLRVVYLSRVSREKNLDGALRILHHVKSPVSFDIVGPQEDGRYWQECEALVRTLPPHVQAAYRGPVAPDQVFDTLARHDLLLLPSLGENYGHVIAESIAVGTRVLVSTLTPWRDLQRDGLGWDLDLADLPRFAHVIDTLAAESPAERHAARERARAAATARLLDPKALEDNRSLFATL